MAEHRETSLIFSLEGLMQRERERILEEEAQHRERLRAAHERQIDTERKAREAEERRRMDQERRFRDEKQRAREEAARLEALRQAELERSRVDAEARAQLEVLAKQHEHERRIEAIRSDVKLRRNRVLALVSSLLAATLACGAAALWFARSEHGDPALKRAYDELVAAERRRGDETRLLVARAEERRLGLLDQLELTTRRLREVEGELQRLGGDKSGRGRAQPRRPGRPATEPAQREACKDDGDPLNGCLKKP
jgi:colicin import membrane protein